MLALSRFGLRIGFGPVCFRGLMDDGGPPDKERGGTAIGCAMKVEEGGELLS